MVAAVSRATQTLLLTLTGVVLVRMAVGDTYLQYVNSWMKWPLIACGVLLLVLGFLEIMRGEPHDGHEEDGGEDDHVPRTAWLLFVPSLVFFLIAPPALGANFAQRAQTAAIPAEQTRDAVMAPLPESSGPVPLTLDELMYRAAYDDAETLADRQVMIEGFVSHNAEGWYVTQFEMSCCAADAFVMRVRANGAEAPPDDQWVRVVGTHVPGTGQDGQTLPELDVESVELIKTPKNQYR
jgi:uncharacterized repeat protein (TIGR03943 family)